MRSFFLLLTRYLEILDGGQKGEECGEYFLIEDVVKLNLLLCLIIVEEDLEELEDLHLDPLLIGEQEVRSQPLYEWVALLPLVLT